MDYGIVKPEGPLTKPTPIYPRLDVEEEVTHIKDQMRPPAAEEPEEEAEAAE